MEFLYDKDGPIIMKDMIIVIKRQASYLSEVDGAIGDGDHGINMKKGFIMCEEKLKEEALGLTASLKTLGMILITEIGGSMGPLYGKFFLAMAQVCEGKEKIDVETFSDMINASLKCVQDIGNAKLGDKTILDTLIPAVEAFNASKKYGFTAALKEMQIAAEKGKDSTKDMVAKVGRASRLGERSRGVLDAGATSCWLILDSMAESIISLLKQE